MHNIHDPRKFVTNWLSESEYDDWLRGDRSELLQSYKLALAADRTVHVVSPDRSTTLYVATLEEAQLREDLGAGVERVVAALDELDAHHRGNQSAHSVLAELRNALVPYVSERWT